MVWHSPFDLQYWFVYVFAGSETLFLAIAFLIIAALSGMFRMPTIITGFMFFLFLIMLGIMTKTLLILAILILGILAGLGIRRMFS